MAQGLECVKCGLPETPHLHPEYIPEGAQCCFNYDDGIKHLKDCPRIRCGGNCEYAIAQQDREAEAAAHRAENQLWFARDRYGRLIPVVVDAGS